MRGHNGQNVYFIIIFPEPDHIVLVWDGWKPLDFLPVFKQQERGQLPCHIRLADGVLFAQILIAQHVDCQWFEAGGGRMREKASFQRNDFVVGLQSSPVFHNRLGPLGQCPPSINQQLVEESQQQGKKSEEGLKQNPQVSPSRLSVSTLSEPEQISRVLN